MSVNLLGAAFRAAADPVLDLFLPERCPLCGGPGPEDHRGFCPDCLAGFTPLAEPFCPVCSLPFAGAGPAHPCSHCRKNPPAYTRIVAGGLFSGGMKNAVTGLKYGGNLTLLSPLEKIFAEMTVERISAMGPFDSVVPIPCGLISLRKRGFDLPAILARRAAKALGTRWRPRLLMRTRAGTRMAGLGLKERKAAVRGLYRAGEKAWGRVLLVDDVITSTLTVRAAARSLKRAGAEEVIVAALARTPLAPMA